MVDLYDLAFARAMGGGAPVPPAPSTKNSDVTLYDYDGTIIAEYTAAEFSELTALPDPPTHNGLIFEGYTYALSDAQEYVTTHGGLDIGTFYITDDNKTRIHVTIPADRQNPKIGIAPIGTATIDWGDGSTPDTITGQGWYTNVYQSHIYENPGDYIITIDTSDMQIEGMTEFANSEIFIKADNADGDDNDYRAMITSVNLGKNVHVGQYAFMNCVNLKTVTKPKGFFIMGASTFMNCVSLQSIAISEGSYPSGSAFMNCVSLDSVCFHKGATSAIASYQFYNCVSLRSITISENVQAIGQYAFNFCSSARRIIVPDSVTTIGRSSFQDCAKIKEINIPNVITAIASAICQNCSSLEHIGLPFSTATIDSFAFSNCVSLKDLELPSTVTGIATQAFYYCQSLRYIKFHPTTPPLVTNANVFQALPKSCIIYVPEGTRAAYISAANYPDPNEYQYVEY